MASHTSALLAVIGDLRVFVHLGAYPVTYQRPYYRKAVALGIGLYRMSEISEARSVS